MKPLVFIDGREGTTGLQIYDRLAARSDIDLLLIDEAKRKDADARAACLNAADLVFLCLPDAAAVEAVSLLENPNTRVIDASTAHRTHPDWVYGLPELHNLRARLPDAKRVANPGCHATGFLALIAPLIAMGLLAPDYPLCCHSLTGYSGGGKAMIAEYEADGRSGLLDAPALYALPLQHKHLPEMQRVAGLSRPPIFSPILGDVYQGMATCVPLQNHLLPHKSTAKALWEALHAYYQGSALISLAPFGYDAPRIAANTMAGRDALQIIVCGHDEQTMLCALFDNLGKGASGAAVQNMNLMLGFSETAGLKL